MTRFHDRSEAGRMLGIILLDYADRNDVLVLALPRGGVAVGFEVSRALHLPLDILVIRKLGVPGREELAMGAVASGGVRVVNRDVVTSFEVSEAILDSLAERNLISAVPFSNVRGLTETRIGLPIRSLSLNFTPARSLRSS